ncbi:MAG: translation initiation factor IF-1 [Proteobacteria bacterium]|nr:translation initiation factor IF-1 [Pseudomonadota bacterium]
MGKADVISTEGKIIDAYPNATFKVRLENDHDVLGHISGKIRQNFIKINIGDTVDIEISPYDLKRGRIIKRH